MRRTTIHCLALCTSALVMSYAAEAHGSGGGEKSGGIPEGLTMTLNDGTVQLVLGGIEDQRLGTLGGIGDLRTDAGGASVDHLWQHWFWYRTEGDTREYALSNRQSGGSGADNHERLVYIEPTDDGATPNALLVELEYTLTDLSTASADAAVLQIAFQLRNLTNSNMNVQFYAYNDFDLSGMISNDVAVIDGSDLHRQNIVNTVTGDRALFLVSGSNQFAWDIDDYADIANRLANGVADTLPNSTSPFGPGDYTGAHQWGVTLAPAPNQNSTLVGSVALVINRATCDSDIAPDGGDGSVGIVDLLKLLADWGPCP